MARRLIGNCQPIKLRKLTADCRILPEVRQIRLRGLPMDILRNIRRIAAVDAPTVAVSVPEGQACIKGPFKFTIEGMTLYITYNGPTILRSGRTVVYIEVSNTFPGIIETGERGVSYDD